ncbi:MAG: GMP synthase-like glutamine amidotransferase [Parasphingorhabdus sp.]|jgi:GMP synthase-like glutamine amidotransferase
MKIGVLQCDHVRAALRQQGFEDYSTVFNHRLKHTQPDIEVVNYACVDGEIPADVHECDGYISTGSRYSVLDDYEWIQNLEDFIVDLVDASVPYFGVCFGHQLLAQALGGKVVRADAGWGIGVSKNVIGAPQPWMGDEIRSEVNMMVFHQDQVVELPAEVQILGGSEFCPIYFCQMGDSVLTTQGHPEFSVDYSRALIELRRDIIAAPVVEAGMESLQKPVDGDLLFRWILNFFNR